MSDVVVNTIKDNENTRVLDDNFLNRTNGDVEPTKNKILIINTGGTLGMVYNEQGFLSCSPNVLRDRILSLETLNFSEKGETPLFKYEDNEFEYDVYDFDPLIDSSDMNEFNYRRVLEYLMKHYNDFNGFIIFHGTDTLSYTSAMLSVFIENLNKPIFITGSAYSIFEQVKFSDGYINVLGTFKYASIVKAPGVYVVCKDKLIDGKFSKKFTSILPDMFCYKRALCGDPSNLPEELKISSDNRFETKFLFPVSINLVTLFLIPYDHIGVYERASLDWNEILLVQGYGNGNVPICKKLLKIIKRHSLNNGITIISSQCPDGVCKPLYSIWHQIRDAGGITSGSMTNEYLLAKISFLIVKKTPWKLMKLLIFIEFDVKFEGECIDLFKILKDMVVEAGLCDTFDEDKKNSLLIDESKKLKIINDIKVGELTEFFDKPFLYYFTFIQMENYNFDDVPCIIMRTLFKYFYEYLNNPAYLQIE